jgi:putative methyltransferase (TIGR04325 family)
VRSADRTMRSDVRNVLRSALPPVLLEAARRVRRRRDPLEWEYAAHGWATAAKGWNVRAVADSESSRWPGYVASFDGNHPFGLGSAGPSTEMDLWRHNLYISDAFVFVDAAGGRPRLSVLDWGGGLGQLYLLARSVLAETQLAYTVKELPSLCERGRELLPEVVFDDTGRCLEHRYDLVMASSSLQFSERWSAQLARLADAAERRLFITRLPVVFEVPSFVVVQRAYRHGYDTEYLGWVLNRDEVVEAASDCGLKLVREFLVRERPAVRGAPEQHETRGFLFARDLERAATATSPNHSPPPMG